MPSMVMTMALEETIITPLHVLFQDFDDDCLPLQRLLLLLLLSLLLLPLLPLLLLLPVLLLCSY